MILYRVSQLHHREPTLADIIPEKHDASKRKYRDIADVLRTDDLPITDETLKTEATKLVALRQEVEGEDGLRSKYDALVSLLGNPEDPIRNVQELLKLKEEIEGEKGARE